MTAPEEETRWAPPRAHVPATMLRIPHAHRNHLTILLMEAAVNMVSVHCETFRVPSMGGKSLTLRPCWEGPTVQDAISTTSQEKPCGILKLSTNMWHWGRGTINMRLGLLQKNNTTVTRGSSSVLAPESSCDFYSFVSILLSFQRTGYVESLTKGGKLTVTCSGYLTWSVSQTALSKGKEYTLKTKPLCSSNFVPVKSVQLFHITSQKHSAFPKVF